MSFTKERMLEIIRQQLSIDMNCTPQDFLRDGTTFCKAKLNAGRRMFTRQTPYCELATMGRGVVVSADAPVLVKVKRILGNKNREDLFSLPFFFGQTLYFIPDIDLIYALPCAEGFTFHVSQGSDIHKLYTTAGFENAIQYDPDHPRPDVLVTYALKGSEIAGMAGASADSKSMWQIGVDVLPPFRKLGLAACLVSTLALQIMERGIVPYYGAASSNIPSQAVAHRSGFLPAWMCTYKNNFDGNSPDEKG